jgi:hypothetical protein
MINPYTRLKRDQWTRILTREDWLEMKIFIKTRENM